jgi:hypothetical protein
VFRPTLFEIGPSGPRSVIDAQNEIVNRLESRLTTEIGNIKELLECEPGHELASHCLFSMLALKARVFERLPYGKEEEVSSLPQLK